ncbi:hypothetical protein M899_1941 [Bacteriovorax sp. BSW11_IV]|uniref:hypothetical protein n=1 Tax=Bacteriovorax sp. BSW11_IV TaxID=1353529 RepID=UPI000389EA71|nr:hypothetical protein [Bacteriovorax sp. BSW11_IV]EQC48424.1 hypothetical protein M899_1941 [Bacteriovorax sp. BSW11_IV]
MANKLFSMTMIILMSLFFFSCSAKKNNSNASFKLYLGAQVLNNYSFTTLRANPVGDALGPDGKPIPPFDISLSDTADGIVEIPNGIWHFQVVAFDNVNLAIASAFCGDFGPVELTGEDAQVEIVITGANCSTPENSNYVTQVKTNYASAGGLYNTPPVATGFVQPNINEDDTFNVTLLYSDNESDQATSCTISQMSLVSLVNACSCSAGVCGATLKGNPDSFGAASFSYSVNTNGQVSNDFTIVFNILAVDDAPVAQSLTLATNLIEDADQTVILNYTDIEGDQATACTISNEVNVQVTTNCTCTSGTCDVGIRSLPNANGPGSFDFNVVSNSLVSNVGTINFTIDPVNDPPAITTTIPTVSVPEHQSFTFSFPYNDVDGDSVTCSTVGVSFPVTCTCSVGNCDVVINPEIGGQLGTHNLGIDVSDGQYTASMTTVVDIFLLCPTHYIKVPGVAPVNDFCVMKYEASNNGSNQPISSDVAVPWSAVSMDNASAYCRNVNEPGFQSSRFDLIANEEWVVIAKNIELQPSNWSNGAIGSPNALNRGWSLATNTNFSSDKSVNCVFNTGVNACAVSGDHNYKRTHNLSNGEVIWDFAGNLSEWVDFTLTDSVLTMGPTDVSSAGYMEPIPTGSLVLEDIGQTNGYGFSQGTGKIIGGPVGALTRGGFYNEDLSAGIFNMNMQASSSASSATKNGFRCVYRTQ